MKLLVVGSSVEDFIHGKDFHSVKPGGIFYTASALHYYKKPEDVIHLVTSISNENKQLFSSTYDELDHKYIKFVEKIPQVHLHLHKNKERDECYGHHITEKIIIAINEFSIYDGILINMITGFDINSEDIVSIRKNYKGLIYLDIHSLARGMNEKKERHFRDIPEKEKWLSSADIVQANESELNTLSSHKSEIDKVKEILDFGPTLLIVTMGIKGARVYTKQNEEIISVYNSSLKINGTNSIGCGDVFGALFFYTYILEKDILTALKKGIVASGCMTSYNDPKDIRNLRTDILENEN